MMYLPHDTDPDIIYVFGTKMGAPTNPDWYHNLTAAREVTVERGTDTYKVTVREMTGPERDRIYSEQARRYQALPSTSAKLLESVPFLCSNLGVDECPKSGLIGHHVPPDRPANDACPLQSPAR